MNNLIVDAGNSFIKIAVIGESGQVCAMHSKNLDEGSVGSLVGEYGISMAIVASSGGSGEEIAEAVRRHVPHTLAMTPLTPVPLRIDYSTPHTLGVDRIAAAIGAMTLYGESPMLIVDFGTAITVDFVSGGVFHGGNISPGVKMRFDALHERTARLPLCGVGDWTAELGDSTASAIAAGVMEGIINEVEGYIARFSAKEPEIVVIFCGGDAKYFVNRIKNAIFANCNMMSVGLNAILEYNAEK